MSLAAAKAWQSLPPLFKDLAVSLLIACLYFPCVLDFGIIWPPFIDWMFALGEDLPGYYLSLAYYRNSEWFFPISRFDTLLYPVGTSVVMTDSIPLLAVPTKLLTRLLPHQFQYYGAWLFSCIWLLAFFSWRTLALFVRSRAVQLMGTVLVTASVPLAERFFHAALSAHWLLLAAFYLVFAPRSRFPVFATCGLALIAQWTHPYLFVMVSGLLAVGVWVHRKLPGAPIGVAVFCWLPILLAWVLGYFHVRETQLSGYGRYVSDLSTLFNPVEASSLLPSLPVRAAAWEGYAYLGLGGIVLLLALCIRVFAGGLRGRRGVVPLAIACLSMAAYAVTATPQFAGTPLFTIPVISDMFAAAGRTFRGTGRFIWPLYYALLIFGTVAIDRLVPGRSLRAALAAVVFSAQLADVGPWLWRHGRAPGLESTLAVRELPAEVRAQWSSASELLVLMPPVMDARCAQFGWRGWRGPWLHLALFGARNGLKTNSDFSASARLGAADRRAVCTFTARVRRHRRRHPEAIVARPSFDSPAVGPGPSHGSSPMGLDEPVSE